MYVIIFEPRDDISLDKICDKCNFSYAVFVIIDYELHVYWYYCYQCKEKILNRDIEIVDYSTRTLDKEVIDGTCDNCNKIEKLYHTSNYYNNGKLEKKYKCAQCKQLKKEEINRFMNECEYGKYVKKQENKKNYSFTCTTKCSRYFECDGDHASCNNGFLNNGGIVSYHVKLYKSGSFCGTFTYCDRCFNNFKQNIIKY